MSMKENASSFNPNPSYSNHVAVNRVPDGKLNRGGR